MGDISGTFHTWVGAYTGMQFSAGNPTGAVGCRLLAQGCCCRRALLLPPSPPSPSPRAAARLCSLLWLYDLSFYVFM
jgi:hypothetical protein